MKKILCLVFAIASFSAFAQVREKGTIELLPHVGYADSFFTGDDAESSESRGSVWFGVAGDYYFNDRWSLRSGILYNSMGADDGSFEATLNYVTIPVNANWHFGSTRKWNLNFGLSAGFLTDADVNGVDVKDQIESFQVGLSYGIGYKLEISKKFSLMFDAQALLGFSDVIKNSASTNRNAGSSINIGGVFKL